MSKNQHKYLSFEERQTIEELLRQGHSINAISQIMERTQSVIFREITNCLSDFGMSEIKDYTAQKGQDAFENRLKNRGRKKQELDKNGKLYIYLKDSMIRQGISPERTIKNIKESGMEFDESIPSKPKLYRMLYDGTFSD